MALIDWSEPIFHDNSITPLQIIRSPEKIEKTKNAGNLIEHTTFDGTGMGMFPIGETTTILYTASDESGNNSTCKLDITVQGNIVAVQHLSHPTLYTWRKKWHII